MNGNQLTLWRERGLTVGRLAAAAGLHPELVARFVEFGLLEPAERAGEECVFGDEALERLCRIERLREHLGVNLAGIAVILELRERVRVLQREVERLRHRHQDPLQSRHRAADGGHLVGQGGGHGEHPAEEHRQGGDKDHRQGDAERMERHVHLAVPLFRR